MNTDMHGKAIAAIHFSGYHTQHGNPEELVAKGNKTLHLSATYHGDHDQFWVIESDDGTEIARHNPKAIDRIIWSPPAHGEVQS